jgi:myosin V
MSNRTIKKGGRRSTMDKIAALKARNRANSMNESYFQPGVKVWIENPYDEGLGHYRSNSVDTQVSSRPMYVPATVISGMNAQGKLCVQTDWHPKLDLQEAIEMVWPMNTFVDFTIDDMIDYTHLHEPAILSNIQRRYTSKQIYTKAGEILLVMNPYTLVLDESGVGIYDPFYMKKYRERKTAAQLNLMSAKARKKSMLSPHIYETADDVYKSILSGKKSQSIIISGESGAGKTETTKQVMQYIANLSSVKTTGSQVPVDLVSARRRSLNQLRTSFEEINGSHMPLIEKQLLQSNPILESFGNAKTMRNNNSSRFGKYLRIVFDSHGHIIGGTIKHFLLEKSRVSDQLSGERSYHFFYQLCRGASPKLREKLRLEQPKYFKFLSKNGSHLTKHAYMGGSNSSDEKDFAVVHEALLVVGLSEAEITQIYSLVAVVLHLGNVNFLEVDDSNSSSGHSIKGVDSESEVNLNTVCTLLGIDKHVFIEALTTKQTKAGGQVMISKIGKMEATEAILSLAKALYAELFKYIVDMINVGIKKTVTQELGTAPDFDTNPDFLFLGLLDIFGFEVFDERNGFEQLMINYANEKLHNLFIKHVFRLEEIKYKEQNIDYSSVSFTDNQNVIDLISKKPLGLFHQVSDACLFGKMKDETILDKMADKLRKAQTAEGNSPADLFRLASIKKRGCFVIKHSANEVTYSIDGFSAKNKDLLKPQLQSALTNESSLPLLQHFFQSDSKKEAATQRSTLTGKNVMLSLKFETDIAKLIDTIERTTPRFVRCIKSNETKRAFYFETNKVYNQLQYLGVLDSVRIRHDGYSYQKSYREFFEHFVIVIAAPKSQTEFQIFQPEGTNYRALSTKVMAVYWKWGRQGDGNNANVFDERKRKDMVQFGTTKLFMRKEFFQALETVREIRLRKMDEASVKMQAAYRMHFAKNQMKKIYKGVGRIQSAWKGIHYRKIWMKRKHAVQVIQNEAKLFLSRRLWTRQKKSILIIQSYFRRVMFRCRFLRIRRGLRVLHGLSRGYIVRRHVLRMLVAVKVIQHGIRKFLGQMRMHWAKVHAVLLVQALWRGKRLRAHREDIVEYLSIKREERGKTLAIIKLQGAWKTSLVQRRYWQIIDAVNAIHRFKLTCRLRRTFLRVRKSTVVIQRVARGMAARKKVRQMRANFMIADELWRVKTVREREALDLYNSNKETIEERRAFDILTLSEEGRSIDCHCIDIDTHVDSSEVYPKGWVKAYQQFLSTLSKSSRRPESVCVGANHTIGIDTVGDVYSWGWGDRGQLGQGKFENSNSSRKLNSLGCLNDSPARQGHQNPLFRSLAQIVMIKQAACGDDHTIALTKEGLVFAWGSNRHGQLGIGGFKNSSSPVAVHALRTRVGEVSCGGQHSVALALSGNVFTWGKGSLVGHSVYMGGGDVDLPRCIKQLKKHRIKHTSCGLDTTVAHAHNGDLYSWGSGKWGQLGHGDFKNKVVPSIVRVQKEDKDEDEKFESVCCGARHCVAISRRGEVYTWGWNTNGQLGHGHVKDLNVPTMVMSLEKERICQVAAGWRHSVALTRSSNVIYAWGMVSCVKSRMRQKNFDTAADRTHNQTTVPLIVPWNSMAGRIINSVNVCWSRLVSVTTIGYFQKPTTEALLCAPILAEQETHNETEVMHMLQDMPAKSVPSLFETPFLPGFTEEKVNKLARSSTSFIRSNCKVRPIDLKDMSTDQLKELILDMQDAIPHHAKMIKNDLSSASPINNRLHYMTALEQKQEFGLKTQGQRGMTEAQRNEMFLFRGPGAYAVDRAKEKSWNKQHGSIRVMNRFKGSAFKRNYPQESYLRSELLKFGHDKSAPERREENMSLNLYLKDTEASDQKNIYTEVEKDRSLKSKRNEVEGEVPDGRILELFSPEHLVATSNEDLSVDDVIAMRIARGVSPSIPRVIERPKSAMREKSMKTLDRRATVDIQGTVQGLVGPAMLSLSRKRAEQSRPRKNVTVNASEHYEKRSVLEIFRAQRKSQDSPKNSRTDSISRANQLPSWSGRRSSQVAHSRRQIEHEINGTSEDSESEHVATHEPKYSQYSVRPRRIERSASYVALQGEVDALRVQLATKQDHSASSSKSKIVDIRVKAESDIRTILESQDF